MPKEVSILAGPDGSRSHRWAERYVVHVQAHGLRAKVVATAGSGDILRRLTEDTKPAIGFLQSGAERALGDGQSRVDLESLGSLYFEPLWMFVGHDSAIREISDLAGKRVFPGRRGSDARATARALSSGSGASPTVSS